MSLSLEERVARIEDLLGLSQQLQSSSSPGSARLKVAAWLRTLRKPGETISAVAILTGADSAETVTAWDADDPVGWDRDALRKAAAICEALSNDVRLVLLQTLLSGPHSTAQLLDALALDRSPLYHHLRYLFANGFIEQPDRGSYALTLRGRLIILLIGHLAYIGPERRPETLELDPDA